jgi:hypothetical protein
MNDLLLEFLGNILDEARVKAVSVQGDTERVVYFGSPKSAQDAITKGTHRPYLAATDKNLPDGDSASEKSSVNTSSTSTRKSTTPVGKTVPTTNTQDLNTTALATQIKSGINTPGNDFSRYSESVSIIISKFITDNPDANDTEVMSRIVSLDCNSATFNTSVKSTIPTRFKKQYEDLKKSGVFSKGCSKSYSEEQNKARFMTMVVGAQKARTMSQAIKLTKLAGVNIDTFSGDAQSLNSMRNLVEKSSGKFFSGDGTRLSKDTLLSYIDGFGTSKFPADTALIGTDSTGNAIFIGFSDKKDLSAIINNSTVTKEFQTTRKLLDDMLGDGRLTKAKHAQVTGNLQELEREYESNESKLKSLTASPAAELIKIAQSNPKELKKMIEKAKTLSGSKSNPDKYWKSAVETPFLSAATGKGIHKTKAKYLEMAGWKSGKVPTETQMMAAFAFMAKEVLESDNPNVSLPKDSQETLFRLGVVDPVKMIESVGKIRRSTLSLLEKSRESLNKIKVSNIPLGTLVDAVRAWKGLHLDMGDYKGTLSMVAEDNVVDYKSIQECLDGTSALSDFAETLQINTKDITSREHGIVTGATVEVFSISPSGQKKNVGYRSIRSKDGILGKLQTTWNFHPKFQDCLSSK